KRSAKRTSCQSSRTISDEFKDFLSHRPMIREVVFKETSYQVKPSREEKIPLISVTRPPERPQFQTVIHHETIMRQQSDVTFAPDRTGQQFERSEFVRQGAWQDDSSFYCRFLEGVADCDHAMHWPTRWPFVGGVVSPNGTFHLSNGLIFRPRTNDASDHVRRSA